MADFSDPTSNAGPEERRAEEDGGWNDRSEEDDDTGCTPAEMSGHKPVPPAIQRLLDEVRNDPSGYQRAMHNRQHNRHNRSM